MKDLSFYYDNLGEQKKIYKENLVEACLIHVLIIILHIFFNHNH